MGERQTTRQSVRGVYLLHLSEPLKAAPLGIMRNAASGEGSSARCLLLFFSAPFLFQGGKGRDRVRKEDVFDLSLAEQKSREETGSGTKSGH